MANVNEQLLENPALRRMPKDEREWQTFVNELSKWIADLDIGGRLSSDANMPQVLLGNMGSVQTTVPMTATDAGASATINVAAHDVSRQSMSVSYNSGTITGLSYNTKYYVYTDDPDFAGGSVTYLTTTSKANIMGSIGRYFVGEIKTPLSGAADKTGAVGAGFAVLEDDLANISEVQSGEPTYVPTNVTTRRTLSFSDVPSGTGIDIAASTGTSVPTLAEFSVLILAFNNLADLVGTVVEDLQNKNVFGS